MGQICGSANNTLEKPGSGILTVYGDHFSPETRTIMCMIEMGQVPHQFHAVDQFKGDHKREEYIKLNPTGSLPTIQEGRFLILGGYLVFLNYLVNKHEPIRNKLYPLEVKPLIDKILLWFQSIMRVTSQRLIRMIIGPQAFGEKQYQQEDIKATLEEFNMILHMLDKKLQRYEFFCGEEVTVADIQIYNEISTILALHRKQIESRENPNVFAWFNKMSTIPEVQENDRRFREIISKYNFA
eukprot:403330868